MNLSNENVIQIEKDGIKYLQFRRLLEYQETINHAYSLGIDKNYRNIDEYEELCYAINSKPKNLVKTNQNHTDNVQVVTDSFLAYQEIDGLITNESNRLLATTNADCILLLFFDPVQKVIANVHSGWKGTIQRISVKAVKKMKEEFNCKPENIICCICPSIRKCHFEVEEDVKEEFEKEFEDLKPYEDYIEEKIPSKKWNIDTVWINKQLLKKEGLKEKNIIDSNTCSVCYSNCIHSFRVEKQGYGLNTALIELRGK